MFSYDDALSATPAERRARIQYKGVPVAGMSAEEARQALFDLFDGIMQADEPARRAHEPAEKVSRS